MKLELFEMNVDTLISRTSAFFEKKLSHITFGYVVVLSLLIVFATISGDDIAFHMQRIDAITDIFNQQGFKAFPMHIYLKTLEGYGYGSPMFYCDLFFIPFVLIGIIFHLQTLWVYKLLLLSILWATFFSIKKVAGWFFESEYQQNLCVFFYMVSTVTFGNEVGSALGRNLAEIFVPIAIGGLYIILYGKECKKRNAQIKNSNYYWIWLAVGMSGLIFSNLLDALIVAGSLFIILIFSIKDMKIEHIKSIVLATVTCILIVAWFVFPMLEQMATNEFVVTSSQVERDLGKFTVPVIGVIFPRQLAMVVYRIFGLSMESLPIAYMSGWLFMFLVSLYAILNCKWLKSKKGFYFGLSVLLLFFTIFQTKLFPFSLFNRYIGFFQFPYRVGIVMAMSVAVLVPTLMSKTNKVRFDVTKVLALITACFVFVSFIGTYGFRTAYHFYSGTPFSDFSYESTSIGAADYLPIELKNTENGDYRAYIENRGNSILTNGEKDVTIQQQSDGPCLLQNNDKEISVEFPRVYYKGYVGVDEAGNIINAHKSENGLAEITVPAFTKKVKIEYKSTAIQKYSFVISIISVCCLLGFIISFVFKKREEDCE